MKRLEVLWNTVGQCRIPWQRPQRSWQFGRCDVISSLPLSVERYIEARPCSALSGAVSVKRQHRLHVRQKPLGREFGGFCGGSDRAMAKAKVKGPPP